MPTVTQILSMRQRRQEQAAHNPTGKFALGCSLLLGLLVALASISITFAYSSLTSNLPPVEALPALLEPPNGLLLQPTRLYDRTGEHVLLALENPATAGRTYLWIAPPAKTPLSPSSPLTDTQLLPGSLISATIATADPAFWKHAGYSLAGIRPESHPTLAQRLVSDLLLQDEPPSLRRALRERLLAAQLTSRFGREKVLEWYLNNANYGRLAYGADAAARLYFNKPATELSLAEAALLAATAEAPALNPLDAPQAALERQIQVVQAMLHYRLISPEEGVQAAREKLGLRTIQYPGQGLSLAGLQPNLAPAFTSLVLSQLENLISRDRLERGGMRIITSLDYDLQSQATCASSTQLARLQASQEEATNDCEAARLLPTLSFKHSPPATNLDAETLILDPLTGQILAMVGQSPSGLQDNPLPDHPAGSLGTTFIYLTAFTHGLSPASLVWDIPGKNPETEPQNFDGQFHGPLRLRTALANDYLIPAQQVLNQVGIENVLHTSRQLDILPPDASFGKQVSVLSLFGKVNLLNVSRAFGIFANQGLLAGQPLDPIEKPGQPTIGKSSRPPTLAPVAVLRLEDAMGEIQLDWKTSQVRPIITSQLAYLLTQVLSDETARWPSLGHPNALEIGRPAAAKIGRTASGVSNWTIGYTPQLVVGIWIGTQDAQGTEPDEPANLLPAASAGLWHAIMQYASRDLPYQTWTEPPGISVVRVCDPSGMLPTAACPNLVNEVFLSGSEPLQADTLYRAVQIDRETGRLATVFTPSDLVEEQVYFISPPEAAEWAKNAGLVPPPETYDNIPANLPDRPDVTIKGPGMFTTIRSTVPITGTASGDEFAYYRLQVGEGLNPQTWLQVGDDITHPVTSGQLAVWDTSGLNGLYTMQLLVIHKDQSVQRATVMLTIDNQPPELTIAYPSGGAEINAEQKARVVFQANVQDNMAIQSVQFYLDDRLLETITQPPFAASWTARPGTHTLRVVATDQAGNSSEASVTFVVN